MPKGHETTVNDTHDFGINRGLKHFRALRRLGEQINRRVLRTEQVDSGSAFSRDKLEELIRPSTSTEGLPAPALKFGEPRVMALFSAVGSFQNLVHGFTNSSLRPKVAALLGLPTEQYTPSKMTYDLRRLRAKGLIDRFRRSNRYELTSIGRRIIYTLLKVHQQLVRPSFPAWSTKNLPPPYRNPLTEAFDALDRAVEQLLSLQRKGV